MNGLEKILSQIENDASEQSKRALEDAEKEVSEIKSRYEKEVEEILIKAEEEGKKEYDSIISKGNSNAALLRRNSLLQVKSSLMDKAYSRAIEKISGLDSDAYYNMLLNMARTIADDIKRTDDSIMQDDDGDYTPAEKIEIVLNARDRKTIGDKLLSDIGKSVEKMHKKAVISERSEDFSGGMYVVYGDICFNSSIEQIVSDIRTATEPDVKNILFSGIE